MTVLLPSQATCSNTHVGGAHVVAAATWLAASRSHAGSRRSTWRAGGPA